ncbi:ATP-grasp domain-containing protein [Priestia aryabhattai]|uniref:ATP-grasp domain-containing protein n=1 Tax=Priestia aryabhattai TaxID=412384 RepID=UPI00203D8CDE|nr:ATP-grasp domain-containing protein [Priestia aryabhattai]MCM2977353.1 ATP-grasp domain-containing protein [Priestia aryabhattai]MED4008239.1 ATP-grasp domain-containing protein [Priestia aryabhattai]
MLLQNKHLAVVLQNTYLPFIFEEAEALGIKMTFFYNQEEVEPKHLKNVQNFIPIDLFQAPEKALEVIKTEHNQNSFDGIMTIYEPALEFVAQLAKELNLPGLSPFVISNCRNKQMMRKILKDSNLNTPYFKEIKNEEEVKDLLLTYPVVIKPSNGFASQGVSRANNKEELIDSIEKVRRVNEEDLGKFTKNKTGIVIEQFIDGPEFAIETFSVEDKVYVLSIGYKGNSKGPFFEEGVYIAPAHLEENVWESISQEAAKAATALGIENGPAHIELRLDPAGKPYVIEIGARIGGSGISHYIVKESTGINYMELVFYYVLGLKPPALKDKGQQKKVVGNYIIPVQGHGIFKEIQGVEDVHRDSEIKRVIQFITKGTEIFPYPHFSGYPGFILTTHDSYSDCEQYYRYLDHKIKVVYDNKVNA